MGIESLLWLANNVICAITAAALYRLKDRSRVGGFVLGLIAGPIGLLIAVSMPKAERDTGVDDAA